MGDMRRTFNRATQLLVGEFTGDLLSRMATKFGVGRLLAQMRVPPHMIVPATRIAVGLIGPALLKMVPGRYFTPDRRATFGAVNVASGLIGLTMQMRMQAFAAVGLSDYDEMLGMADWETADDGVGDWETADDGVGGYELAEAPYAGVLGDGPPAGVLDYDTVGAYGDTW